MKQYLTIGIAMLAGAAVGAAGVSGLHAQGKTKAYSVSELEVIDANAAAAYGPLVQPRIRAAGGRVLNTAGGKVTGIVGAAPPTRIAINEWDSVEQAQAFFKSSAWLELAPQRDKAQKVIRVYAVETVN
jgi:uncharacterized protein (DUF1330 family)